MKKFTTVLAAASLMLAGLASCNEPGPQPEPPVPEATWDEKVGEWKAGTNFTGDLPLPVAALEGLDVTVAEAEGQIKVTIPDLPASIPEPEEGEEVEVEGQPVDYYTVYNSLLRFVVAQYIFDDEEIDEEMGEGTFLFVTGFDADGDFVNFTVDYEDPWSFLGYELPGEISLTFDAGRGLSAEDTLKRINDFVKDDAGVAGSNLLKEGETLDNVGAFFRVEEQKTNVLVDTILDVADVFEEDAYIDDEDDLFVEFYWDYASEETTEAVALNKVANELIDELNFETTMAEPVASIDAKGRPFTYLTMKEGPYARVDLRLVARTVPYDEDNDVIDITIYAMPKEAGFDGEIVNGLTIKTPSKPEGPGVVPAEDALLNVLDVESEGKWTYESRYTAIGNLIETKAANAQGDTVNGNFFELNGQLQLMLSLDVASQPNTAAIAPINNYLANWLGEGGFTQLIPDLQTTLTEGGTLNVKVTTYTDHEGQKTFLLDYYDYYPTASFDGEDTVTYAQRWKQLIEAQTYTPEGAEEPVKTWATPEQRTTSTGVTYWATRGNEKVTVGTGMDAKDKCIHIQWVPQNAFLRVIIYVDDAPAEWNVAGMNKLTTDAGFTTVVPHLEGELFFNLDQYLQYGQFVCYAPDAESELLEAFAEQFVCLPEDEDEDPEALPARDPEPEPEPEPEWIDESFDYSGMWIYQFASIEQVNVGTGIDAAIYGGSQIQVQAYNQGGISYFIVEINTPFAPVTAYVNESVAALGFEDCVFDSSSGYIEYLLERGYASGFDVLANNPYNPVAQTNFQFAVDIYTQYGSYIMSNDVVAYYNSSDTSLVVASYSASQIVFYFVDPEQNTVLGQFTASKYSDRVRLIWNVGMNQNQPLDVEDINATLAVVGKDYTLDGELAAQFGDIFAHDYIDDWYITNVRSTRFIDDFELLGTLIEVGFELFNVGDIDVDLSGWNTETLTGKIVIIIWDDPESEDRESIFELTITVTVADTTEVPVIDPETGEQAVDGDGNPVTEEVPSEWRVTITGWWAHFPQA